MVKNTILILGALLVVQVGSAEAARKSSTGSTPPDFTKGAKVTERARWAFGSTGAYGWIWANRFNTTGAKQAYVTNVDEGSPAAKVLKPDDVILGVVSPASKGNSAGMFSNDARKELAAAIIEAEKTENGGKLVLNVWRKGKTFKALIQLRPMGTFSATAPAQCKKTEKIIQQAAAYLQKNGIKKGIAGHFDALGLLATGDKKYLPVVQAYARSVGKPGQKLELSPGMKAWHWGFANLMLTEYYLATGDKYVLPAIKEYTTKIAMGQSKAGTWGHGVAIPVKSTNGHAAGILDGYGAINQSGLVCSISLVLGKKCGVKSPVVDKAIERASRFFRFYVHKGGVPYGDHHPAMNYSANGKTAGAAVLFDLLGDAEAASFFAKMSVAAHREIESGHTGNFWSLLWGPLGAGCAGDEAAGALLKEIRWFTEMERRWSGNMVYQGTLTRDPYKYRNWSTTGLRLMHHCLPRKKLYITGRGGRAAPVLKGQELADVIQTGHLGKSLEDKSTKELLGMLRSWSPVVRRNAGEALGKKDDNVVKQLVGMLNDKDPHARYGACEGLRAAGRHSPEAAKALVAKALKSSDPSLQYHALYAFTFKARGYGNTMTGAAHLALPTVLDMAATMDPADAVHAHIAYVLFSPGRGQQAMCGDLSKVDRTQLVKAIRALLKTHNGKGRGATASVYSKLGPAELKQLWGDIYIATTERAPSGVMFADGVRVQGVRLMAKHGVKEGLDAGTKLVTEDRWGAHGRLQGGIPAMSGYGAAVKDHLPMLKAMVEKRYGRDEKNKKKCLALLEKMAKGKAPKLISIDPYIKKAKVYGSTR